MLALVQIPQHSDTVLSTGSTQGTVGGNGNVVDVAGVTVVVGLQLALGQIPDLIAKVLVRYAILRLAFSTAIKGALVSFFVVVVDLMDIVSEVANI